MIESERAFVSAVAQIVPVLLLALVVEARIFKFTHADALPSVKQARIELHNSMSRFDYWGWRTLVGLRRWGIGISLSVALVTMLTFVEVVALWLLARDLAPNEQLANGMIAVVATGAFAAGVLPVYGQLVHRNVQLNNLEIEVQTAVDARLKEQHAARARAEQTASKRRGWRRFFSRRRTMH